MGCFSMELDFVSKIFNKAGSKNQTNRSPMDYGGDNYLDSGAALGLCGKKLQC